MPQMNILDKLDNWLYKYQEEQLHFFWAFAFAALSVQLAVKT